MRLHFFAFCAGACALLVACADRHPGLPPLPPAHAINAPPPPGAPTVHRDWPSGKPVGPMSDAANAIMADFNRSHAAVLGPMSPKPSSFENSCAPEPYVFQSNAGYEAVRVKDCRNDQLLYLPASETARIGRYVEECNRVCSGQTPGAGTGN